MCPRWTRGEILSCVSRVEEESESQMSQTIQSNPQALVESVARMLAPSARDDFRNLMNEVILANLTALSPGGNLLRAGGAPAGASAPPVGVTHAVIGANGVLTVGITNPVTPTSTPIYHEFSYSPLVSFKGPGVTTLPPTTATSFQVPAVGGNYYCRLRSSFDRKTWSGYTLSSTQPIDSGYVESSALSSGATFNQTNFAVVETAFEGSGAAVSIHGTAGQFTPYPAIKGSVQSLRPSATIIATELAPNQFVAWDGSQFRLTSTLADLFADDLEPVGAVIAGGGTPGGGGASGGNGGRLSALQI